MPEGLIIDYKRDPYGNNDADKKEALTTGPGGQRTGSTRAKTRVRVHDRMGIRRR